MGLPTVCYLAAFLCNDVSGCPVPSALHPKSLTLATLKDETGWPVDGVLGLGSFKVTAIVLGYYAVSLLLQTILPGTEIQGPELRSGGKLQYKLNGTIHANAMSLSIILTSISF